MEHLQTNGQVEAANKVILVKLRKRLDGAKGQWREELFEVLWAYKCTPQSATNESTFSLVYGVEVMIPVEIGNPHYADKYMTTIRTNRIYAPAYSCKQNYEKKHKSKTLQ